VTDAREQGAATEPRRWRRAQTEVRASESAKPLHSMSGGRPCSSALAKGSRVFLRCHGPLPVWLFAPRVSNVFRYENNSAGERKSVYLVHGQTKAVHLRE
jgi:hypothetical protein